MPPLCPIDNIQLVSFSDDVDTGQNTFWECPAHHGRYVSYGMSSLIPVPRALVSNPPAGFRQVWNIYVNQATPEFVIVYEDDRRMAVVDTDLVILRLHAE